jgi:hypothetical protein
LQSPDGVIRKQFDDSSRDQVVIATRKYLSESCRLLDTLGDPGQQPQHRKKGSRFALFRSFTTWCIISDADSETARTLDCGLKNIPSVFIRWTTDTSPPTGKHPQHPAGDEHGDLLTTHYHLHILDKAKDDLENVCYGLPSLVLRQPAQPLDNRLHFLLANNFPNKFFFIHKSR